MRTAERLDMADPIGTMKNIAELIKKYNDLELMKQIVSLQTEVFDLQTENLALKKQLTERGEREKMKRTEPHGYYYEEGNDVPHCPKCWEKDEKAITLPAPRDSGSYQGRTCRVCNHYYKEGPASRGESHRQVGGTWS
jgi:hypothetical protein